MIRATSNILVPAAGALLLSQLALAPSAARADAPESEQGKAFYMMGVEIGKNVASRYTPTAEEAEAVQSGLRDALAGQATELDEQVYGPKLNDIARERMAAATAREKEESEAYVEKMAAEDGAERTDSGIVYLELEAGSGESPGEGSTVTAHYHGTFRDGSVFDSSVERGRPVDFPLKGVIPCWTEALQRMKVGGKARITCPSDLAYGDRGAPPKIPGGAALTFEVELVGIK